MGASQSVSLDEHFVSLPTLLSGEEVDWNEVARSVRQVPDQACLYCHSTEPSPLQVAVAKSCPSTVANLLVEAYPDALHHADHDGNTAAHAAVESNCEVQLMQMLIRNNADIVRRVNKEGRLPLHMNIRDVDTTRLLIQSFPQSVKQRDCKGQTPLHRAIQQQQISITVIQMLLDSAAPSLVRIRDKSGASPLDLLKNRLEISLKSDSSVSDLWNLFLSLLPSNESQLHAIVDLACPLLVTRRALLEFPFQVSQRDDQGRTALHIAAATNTSNVIIAELVQHFPPAARMTDAEGRLPIDIAAEYGKDSYVVEALIKAEPRALDTRDLRDKRYPFVSAAMGDHENTVATTYYLLRAKPHVISYFHLD